MKNAVLSDDLGVSVKTWKKLTNDCQNRTRLSTPQSHLLLLNPSLHLSFQRPSGYPSFYLSIYQLSLCPTMLDDRKYYSMSHYYCSVKDDILLPCR
jgi:hypothetical protein